tara:strand:+ start:6049 stop:6822 length:774 start_codon:yes stop_codon:yes gene_type:complete
MTELVAENISVTVDGNDLIDNTSLALRPGELVAILGANGAGKTTLLRAMLGLQSISAGRARLGGIACSSLPAKARARKVSYLPQRRPLAWPNTVIDIVSLGRFAHGAALGRLGADDAAAVNNAIRSCDLEDLRHRNADSLSGGELARVHFARAMAAKTPLLVADEPVAALDPRHQLRIADLIRRYVDNGGGALVVLHDVALAATYADRLVWMKSGAIISEGSPEHTLTAATMHEIYGVRARVNFDEHGPDIRIATND